MRGSKRMKLIIDVFYQALSDKHFIFSFFTQLILLALTLIIFSIEIYHLFNKSVDIPKVYMCSSLIIMIPEIKTDKTAKIS